MPVRLPPIIRTTGLILSNPQNDNPLSLLPWKSSSRIGASLNGTKGYVQFEYIKEELSDLMAAADIMISRAGANAICEILALRKPMAASLIRPTIFSIELFNWLRFIAFIYSSRLSYASRFSRCDSPLLT